MTTLIDPVTAAGEACPAILDSEFAIRYTGLVDIIKAWTERYFQFEQSDVLDFGCGEGITALGFARRLKTKSVTAVDIMPDVHQCLPRARAAIGLNSLPANLRTRQISVGENFYPNEKFDLIYSWSVLEHVEQPMLDHVIGQLKSRLKPNGLIFSQIAPLYYSAEGAHLCHRLPGVWRHLLTQDSVYYSQLTQACQDEVERDALWSCYQTLNKLTAPELKRRFERAGMTLVAEYTTEDQVGEPPPELLEIFNRSTLMTNQVVLLYKAV